MPNEKNWYLGKICTRFKQNLEKNLKNLSKIRQNRKLGLKWPKMNIFSPNFVKPIVYQQYSGICRKKNFAPFFLKKWVKKRFFKFPIMANYGQLWPNYDREVIFFLVIQNATKS